ncbi:MAG: hypothetical protein PVH68_01705 [Armatimonadota bacterium]|jgi:hypothetical protein
MKPMPVALGAIAFLSATPAFAAGPAVDKPAEPRGELVLENARQPGTLVDVSQIRGKPVVIRGMCPE